MLVAASEGSAGESLGRLAVGFRLERGDALGLQLVLEAVDEVLFREAAGGLALIAQQVPHGVVVLAVRQATHGQRLQAAPIGPGDSLPSLTCLLVGKAGQVVDPAQQHGFVSAARLDRWPPVCFTRRVGFRSNSDRSGFRRSTRSISASPNAAIRSWPASGSGNASRVSDATPLSL